MFIFWKIWRALFSCNHHFRISPFSLLPAIHIRRQAGRPTYTYMPLCVLIEKMLHELTLTSLTLSGICCQRNHFTLGWKFTKLFATWRSGKKWYWFLFIFIFIYDGSSYHIETSPLICIANQWTGFYTIGTSVMNELKIF